MWPERILDCLTWFAVLAVAIRTWWVCDQLKELAEALEYERKVRRIMTAWLSRQFDEMFRREMAGERFPDDDDYTEDP